MGKGVVVREGRERVSLFTPAVLIILGVSAALALVSLAVRARIPRIILLAISTAICAFGIWFAATDAWAFRDGFPLPSTKFSYPETHGLAAARAFFLGFWVPLIAILITVSLIGIGWARRDRHPPFSQL